MRAGTIEPVEARADRLDLNRVECAVGRELGAWIGTVGRVEPDAVRGEVVGPAQLGEELSVRLANPARRASPVVMRAGSTTSTASTTMRPAAVR